VTQDEAGRRKQILQQASEYILQNGVAELSLRPLAAALRTSPRMLLYYFTSKEQLVAEALEAIRETHEHELLALPAKELTLAAYWSWATDPAQRPYLQLLYEVFGISVRDAVVAGHFLHRPTFAWQASLEEQVRARGLAETAAQAISAYVAATVTGLEINLLATGDLDRVNAAFAVLEDQVGAVLTPASVPARS
jgi:AcrR family transcriptional regulator